MYNSKSFLDLKVIWKDNDMFELQVKASNDCYMGTTNVYDTKESLSSFAQLLKGYPKDNNVLFYQAGQKDNNDSYAYFSMKFYCIDNAGHVGVQINLEENVATEYRPEEKDKVILEILVEPAAIDRFQKDLFDLATKEDGQAILIGNNLERNASR